MPTFRSLGDLSTTFLLQRQTGTLKAEIQRRATEMSTGRVADLSAAVRGDFRTVASIEHGLRLGQSDRLAIAEAEGFAIATQAALASAQAQAESASAALLRVPDVATAAAMDRAGATSRQALEAVIGVLNQKSADRSMFAGDATDGPALAPADAILAAVGAVVSGLTDADDVVLALDAWFETPGTGFDTQAYAGATDALAPFRLGAGESVTLGVSAADPALRSLLKGLALGALVEGAAFGGTLAEREALSRRAAEAVLTASNRVTEVQADVGAAEQRIAAARARQEAEAVALQSAQSALVGTDPYDAATRLETAQTQLETLFALTARVSRLSLVDFLR